MRATCRVRSRSTSIAGAVHVCVRDIACRSSSDSVTPAAAAFAFHSANSADVTRACAITVRRKGARPAIRISRVRRGHDGARTFEGMLSVLDR